MKVTKIKAIYKKEILDLLRDKKTLIMMLLVPLLLYPLIMVCTLFISSAISNNMQSSEYKIAIRETEGVSYDRDTLVKMLEDTTDGLEYHLAVVESEKPEEQLASEEIDAYIVVENEGNKLVFDVCYLSSINRSSTVSDMIGDKLELFGEYREETFLNEMNLDADYIMNSVKVNWSDFSNKEEQLGSILGTILPFILISSILMGALYPAIDTTSGEKERGTLETVLTLPVRNDELIMGKFLAVATITVASAFLNLVSMGIMAAFLYNIMSSSSEEMTAIELVGFIPVVLIVILCIVTFSLFLSAITMCVTAFAKSFKEANNYSTPLLLVVMLSGYICFIPNIEFNGIIASIPVVNICLLVKNLLLFKYNISLIAIVLVTNVAYAILAIWALSKVYNSEDVLFGEGGVSLQIFTNRKELKKGGVPNFSDAILVAAISLLLYLYVGTLVQLKSLMGGLLVNQLIIIGIPVLVAWYTKKDFKSTFSLKMPKMTGVLGAVCLEVSAYILVLLLSAGLVKLFLHDLEGLNQGFTMLLDGMPFVGALLVMAFIPSVCEEVLFRGYIWSATKNKFRAIPAMLLVGALFGIFHMSISKFFTTGLLGVVFCYVVYKSGSIALACLMHFMNNAFSVVMAYYGEEVQKIMPVLFKETLEVKEIVVMLLVAAIFGVAGCALLQVGGRRRN